jgi:CDGSH-type Zn-finger protein
MKKEGKIVIEKNGPYVVSNLPLSEGIIKTDNEGYPIGIEKTRDHKVSKQYLLCRCGYSSNKPFCDSSHATIKFDGTETAEKLNFKESTDTINGPNFILEDIVPLCSGAGFCHGKEGSTWDLINSENKKLNKIAVKQACNCPSGRLLAIDKKTGKPIEQKFKPSVVILKEPLGRVGSSILVRGNVPIFSSDGKKYEVRNRVALCRCGKSQNKPCCDSTHNDIRFKG